MSYFTSYDSLQREWNDSYDKLEKEFAGVDKEKFDLLRDVLTKDSDKKEVEQFYNKTILQNFWVFSF
jgi:hypothetical protein